MWAPDLAPYNLRSQHNRRLTEEVLEMAKFMDVHDGFNGVTAADVAEAHRADLEIQGSEGVRFTHWWADPATGKVFCLSEGPSREAVASIHARAGHPTEQIYELQFEGE